VSLWTPDGERPVSKSTPEPSAASAASAPTGDAGGPNLEITPEIRAALSQAGIDVDTLTPEQQAEAAQMLAEMARARQQLLEAPVQDVIANHLMGLYELGAIHLGENPPHFAEASLAIEALGAVLDRLEGNLGEPEEQLRQARQQLQMAFVQLKEQVAANTAEGAADETDSGGTDSP
jgi:hypothetical protein